jgi:hypothetical protein
MLNIHELEKKWLRYKIKSYIPHMVIFISSLLIVAILFLLTNLDYFKSQTSNLDEFPKQEEAINTQQEKNISQEMPQTVIIVPTQKAQTPAEVPAEVPKVIQVTQTEQKLLVTPSMNFIKNIQHDDISYNKNESYKSQTAAALEKPEKNETPTQTPPTAEFIEETVLSQPIKIEEKSVHEEEHVANSISIKRQNEYSDIEEIIARFKKNNNPTLSLFIAKKYYELGEYRNAYNYSLITNELNKDIEASWIIFAQSLVKLNEKEKAIKILQEYIKHSNSKRANLLLDEILSGKFK